MNTTPITAPPRDLIQAMQAMRADDPSQALKIVEAALVNTSDRAPYLALASLAALRLGNQQKAIPFLRELIEINPQDAASRANLANALIEQNQLDEALLVVGGRSEPGMARIEGFLRQQAGNLAVAAKLYRQATAHAPNDLSSWNNLGNVLAELGEYDEAIPAFERAISLAPGELKIYLNLADVLSKADRVDARHRVLEDARKLAPDNVEVLVELGNTKAGLDDMEGAIATLRHAIDVTPDFTDAHIELGMIYENLNRTADLDALASSVDRKTAPPEAAFLFAWQARRAGNFEQAARFAKQIPETIHAMRRHHLIGGIADRQGDADTAFKAFEEMNRAAVESVPPLDEPTYRSQVEDDLTKWTPTWAAGFRPFESLDDVRDPVFLVGFPRSGTTLLDTMLMGQPELSVLEERPMVARTLKLIGDEDLPKLGPDRLKELRAAYFNFARESGWNDSRWLVDKHPLNMERIPIIHRLFPQAKFILAERHPCDVVLSCFMANFTMNLAMRSFTSLDEAALTYDAVFRAWDRGRELFPIDYRPVRYERLVSDATAELTPIIEWLGLELDDNVFNHTKTAEQRGRVRTASYSQIGEALYTRASGRWVHYRRHLEPIIPVLEPWVRKMGYELN